MKNSKKTGRLTGIFFIIATAAGVSSVSFVGITDKENFLTAINNNPSRLAFGALLIIIMALACAAIAMSIYPVIKKHRPGLAIGSVGFRLMEATLFIVSAICLLSLVPVANDLAQASDAALSIKYSGTLIRDIQNLISSPAGLAFSTGALLYYIAFYSLKLVPRWLSVWGIVAIIMHIIACVAIIFGESNFSTTIVILNVPIGLQEMVLAVWLIVKGFNSPVNV